MAKNHTTAEEIDDTDLHASGASATYCPEDDKIRLYCGRVERSTYNFLRANKFVATPKQSCDFVAVWSPKAEDIAFQLIPEDADIEDEDYSPEERAADRAERFAGYRDKRRTEAGGHADTYDSGPSAFGNQNADRAQRQATRHERHRDRALCQWSKAEYWQTRTAAVIGHALHRSDASTRRGRILTLEADQRRHATPGSRYHDHLTMRLIYENAMLENEGGTAAAVEMIPGGWIRGMRGPSSCLENILGGWLQIQGLNKSPVTGRIVSVKVWGYYQANGVEARKQIVTCNIERLGENCYRAPTPEELEAFTAATSTAKAARRATAPAKPTLINPTPEDAQKLQDEFNRVAKEDRDNKSRYYGDFEPLDVCSITQETYSNASKGDYARAETRTLHAGGKLSRRESNLWTREGSEYDKALGPALCKVRIVPRFPSFQIVVLTDKPQKALPAGWNTTANTVTPEPEEIIEPEEAPEQEPAVCDESTEIETVAAGCLF